MTLRAGDRAQVIAGPDTGRVGVVTSVRMYSTYCGYHLRGGLGLYEPSNIALVEPGQGNPCGQPCNEHLHRLGVPVCEHCAGGCYCRVDPARSEHIRPGCR
ncbi:KOW motif domain-containing protein [Nocardia takedensis]|uniref:KOW motif domain-containing protein n=1 Tax=Nocardia takedensis TaxID=259390 RepID=UPI003F760A3B